MLHDDDDDEEMAGLSEEEKAEKRIEKLKKLDKSLDMVRLWLLNEASITTKDTIE